MRAKWSPHEEESCVRILDRLVVSTKQSHSEEQDHQQQKSRNSNDSSAIISPSSPEQQQQSKLDEQLLDAQRAREMQELRLFAEAVHGQDVIGLTTLAQGFWNHKNAMCRQKYRLEKVLPKKQESEELLENLRQLQLNVEDPKDAQSVARLIDTIQRASFCDLARCATEMQNKLCQYSPIVAAHQALNLRGLNNNNNNNEGGIQLRQPNLMLSEEGQENRLAESVRVADSSLQDAEMRASQLREQLEGLFSGFETLKLPRAMHSFVPRGIAAGEVSAPRSSQVIQHSNMNMNNASSYHPSVTSAIVNANTAAAAAAGGGGGGGNSGALNNSSVNNNINNKASNNSLGGGGGGGEALVNGYTTMHLLRVLCVEAAPHDTPEGLASQYGVEPHCVTDVHQQQLAPLEAFKTPTLVLVHIGTPMRGLEESITSLNRRIELIESTTLPRAKERLVAARESLWASELDALQAPLKGDGGVTERRRAVESLERDQKRAADVLEQCKNHRDSILGADFGRVSFLLEAKQLEALEGLGASERLTYTCREIPKGVSVPDFAARMGIPAGEVVTFIDPETETAMAYIPTLVPRQSLVTLDEKLRKEMNDFKVQHPDLPPRTDLLEQLAALRAGDVSTLFVMLNNIRHELEAGDHGKTKVERDEIAAVHEKLKEAHETSLRVIDSRNETIQLLRAQNDQLQDAVSAAKERADAADGALQQSKNENAALDADSRSINDRCAALTESLQSAEHRSQNLARELQIQAQEQEEQLMNIKMTATDEIATVSAEATSLRTQVDTLRAKCDGQKEEISQYIKKLDGATQQRDEARQNAEQLRTQLAESNLQAKQATVMQADRNNAQAHADQASAELAESKRVTQARLDEMDLKVKAAEAKADHATQRMKKLEDDANKAMQARDLQLAAAHEACRKTETTSTAAREAAEQETAVLRRQLQSLTSELATARADRWNKSADIQKQQDKLNASNNSASGDNNNNEASSPHRNLSGAGLASPQRGLLDPPLAAGAASPQRRILYVCRPLPRGNTANQIASEFGVSAADVLGPFTETHTGDQFVYVPTVASASPDILREDERIRAAIIASGSDGLPSVTLLEALHALRSGDVATLAAKVVDGEERVAKAEALLALQARENALSGGATAAAGGGHPSSLDFEDTQALLDDDTSHDSNEILQQKIHLLKEALANLQTRVTEWKALADDYKQKLIAEQADDVTAEQVKADYQQRLDNKMKEMNSLEQELAQSKADMQAAERRKEEELEVLKVTRKKIVEEKDQQIGNLKRQNDEVRSERDKLIKLLNEGDD